MDDSGKSDLLTIYMDESGNTGSNIYDQSQPIFTLASCNFDNNEAKRLLDLVGAKPLNELHYKRLKRRKPGRDGIIRLLKNELINSSKVKASLFHKEFMITTKIVDLLIEHMMFLMGEDLYKNGANLALSNMWHFCFPVFCGKTNVDAMHSSFVKMIREQSPESISNFYKSVEILLATNIKKEFEKDINLILSTKNIIYDALDSIDKTSLDPSIPAVFSQCVAWGEHYSGEFKVVHDDSNTVEQQEELLSLFMDWTRTEEEVGYDRRKFKLPLKARSLNFSNSQTYLQIQVADIIASSIAFWAYGVNRGKSSDDFFNELNNLNLDDLIVGHKIWPTMDVTPESLGTVFDGGTNPADHMVEFVWNAQTKQD